MVDVDDDFRRMSVKSRKTSKDQKSTTSKKAKDPSGRGAQSTKDVAFQKKQSSKETDKGKTKHISYLKKKEINSIVSTLKKIELVPMKNCILDLLKKEKHIEQNDRRKGILEDLKKTVAMSKLVSQLFSMCISLLKAGLSYNFKDRDAKYRIAYTFYVRDALSCRSSQVMKWFERRYFTNEDKNHYICVVNSIAVIVFQFFQQHVLSLKKKKLEDSQSKTTVKTTNSILSLLTLAGGTFGKVYKCVK